MKILFITANLNECGGIQKYNANFLNCLKKNEVCLAELKNNCFVPKAIFILSVLIKFLISRPKIIICSHINFAPLGYFLKKVFGKNYLVMTHGIEVWNLKDKQIKYLKNAKIVSTVSVYTKERILAAAPELKTKIFILPNTIDADKFKSKVKSTVLTKKFGLENNKIILSVSRLAKTEKYKGYDKIIQSLPAVAKEIKNIKYILAGSGDDAPRIKQLIKDLKIGDYVFMPGYIPEKELVDYYNLCDVFVMPSKGEGFGIVFLEALACGKPVIAGNQDGSADAVLDGKLGILVNPDNIDEIAENIIKILKKKASPNLLNSDYLRNEVLKNYGFDKFKEKVKNLIYGLSR